VLSSWRAVHSYVHDNQIDVVHLHKVAFIPLALLLHFTGIRCVLTLHGCAWRLRRWPLHLRAIFWLLDCLACLLLPAVVIVGKHDHAAFARLGGRRLHWIPNGVQPGPARSSSSRAGVVYIGRISPEKNILAMAKAAEKAHLPLDIYGPLDVRDPRGVREFLSQVKGSSCVRYRGPLPASAVRETLAQYRTFVNLSFAEGLPVAVLEAAAESLHLVLSDIPAHRDLGLPQCQYVDPHDIDLACVDQLPAGLAKANRLHVQQEYDLHKMLSAYEAVYWSMATASDDMQKSEAKGTARVVRYPSGQITRRAG
jgi:glycosyltransferase involved in cell wall biosynthesis